MTGSHSTLSTSTIASYILQKMLGISTPDSTGASRLKILLDTFPLSHIVCQWVSEQQNSAKSLHPSTGFFCTSCTPDQASGWKPPVTLEKGALPKGCLAKGPWSDLAKGLGLQLKYQPLEKDNPCKRFSWGSLAKGHCYATAPWKRNVLEKGCMLHPLPGALACKSLLVKACPCQQQSSLQKLALVKGLLEKACP